MSDGTVKALWVKRFHGGPMDAKDHLIFIADQGIAGNVDLRSPRHVTVIDWGRWQEAQNRLDVPVDPSARRANVLVDGLHLADSRDRILRIGEAKLLIRGETRPCEMMDEAQPGLQEELKRDWGGGVWGKIIEGGVVRVGDSAAWEAPDPETTG